MTSLRFSIRGSMAALVIIGLGLTAWRAGSHTAFRAVYTATIVMLFVAVIAARYRTAAEGAFWFGFAVFGWGYFLFGLTPLGQWDAVSAPGGRVHRLPAANPLLPTSEAIEWLAQLQAEPRYGKGSDPADGNLSARPVYNAADLERKPSIIGVGHLGLVWILGAVGGLIAMALAGRRGSSTETTSG